MGYKEDRKWSDKHLPRVRQIVGPKLLVDSPKKIDCEEAGDLVIQGRELRIGVRIRRHEHLDDYGHQFTIRAHRDNNYDTEIDKLIDGKGDLFFYGFSSKSGPPDLEKWILIDLDAFRAQLLRNKGRKKISTGFVPNGDGTGFRWFNIRSLEKGVIIDAVPAVSTSSKHSQQH